MARKKQQLRKDKNRKQKAKNRVLQRREKLRAVARESKEAAKMQEHYRVKLAPIRNENKSSPLEPQMTPQTEVEDARKSEWVRKKLEHNMKILEALEKEMELEEQQRATVQESLKAEGAETLRDQMDYLAKRAEKKLPHQNQRNLGPKSRPRKRDIGH